MYQCPTAAVRKYYRVPLKQQKCVLSYVRGIRIHKSRCRQGPCRLKAVWEDLPCAFLPAPGVAGDSWCSLAVAAQLQSLPPVPYRVLSVSIGISPFLVRTPVVLG